MMSFKDTYLEFVDHEISNEDHDESGHSCGWGFHLRKRKMVSMTAWQYIVVKRSDRGE